MTQFTTASSIQVSRGNARSLFPNLLALLALATFLAATIGVRAQAAATPPDPGAQTQSTPATASPADAATPGLAVANKKAPKGSKTKGDKVVQSKDTKQADKKAKKVDPLVGKDANLPDKVLYDKAMDAVKHGRFDVARLDLQTLLNTYPDSQYMMRAKLGVADSWYKEGGAAALTQSEQEYKDFITFFPNVPEAAEAQMRIGDIYFRQMDKPDRDYSNTIHAEEAYRLMLQQFPDSTRVPEAKQHLREVQETLASREADIASFYSTHQNWSATIARYQTVVDTYPLYSHLDDVLVGLGDAYESEAAGTRAMKAPAGATKAQQEMFEAGKARLLKIYDDEAAAAFNRVVLEHSASAHVEDAKDRLVAMGRPVPTPTPEQAAASLALENSRGQYTLSSRVELFVLHKADTVPAASVGDPPLEDAKPTLAPNVTKQTMSDYYSRNESCGLPAAHRCDYAALAPSQPSSAAPARRLRPPPPPRSHCRTSPQPPRVRKPAPQQWSPTCRKLPLQPPPAEVRWPSRSCSPPPVPLRLALRPPRLPPSQTQKTPRPRSPPPPQQQPRRPSDNGGLKPLGPSTPAALPPIEKPAAAPDAINEVTPGSQPPAQTAPANGKKPKPAFDKADESSSKHKKKKGLAKLNPF